MKPTQEIGRRRTKREISIAKTIQDLTSNHYVRPEISERIINCLRSKAISDAVTKNTYQTPIVVSTLIALAYELNCLSTRSIHKSLNVNNTLLHKLQQSTELVNCLSGGKLLMENCIEKALRIAKEYNPSVTREDVEKTWRELRNTSMENSLRAAVVVNKLVKKRGAKTRIAREFNVTVAGIKLGEKRASAGNE